MAIAKLVGVGVGGSTLIHYHEDFFHPNNFYAYNIIVIMVIFINIIIFIINVI